MTENTITESTAIQRALEVAQEASSRLPAAPQSSSFGLDPAFVENLQALSTAQDWQSEIAKVAQRINEPLASIKTAIERSQAPLTGLSERIAETMRVFSANTAASLAISDSTKRLQDTVAQLTGKNSAFEALIRTLGKNRKIVGDDALQIANKSKGIIQEQFSRRKDELTDEELEAKLAGERVDMTLPVDVPLAGTIHPVSQVMDELAEIFADLGFAVATGPELETDWHNFTALNIPESHPARAMHDTFYLAGDHVAEDRERPRLLRTHTSPVQIRTMLSQKPPIRIIAPGRTYRSDSDATHTPMFHQVEGLVIDKGITMGHLKWTLETFLKAFFERDDIVLRLRPSYFPFTEPSAEVDVGYTLQKGKRVIGGGGDVENGGWMEVLGSGLVHPKVIAACGLDPDEWQGFAFGCGIDRLAMLKYGMDDLRAFFDGDIRWLKHYGFSALDVPTLSGGVGAA